MQYDTVEKDTIVLRHSTLIAIFRRVLLLTSAADARSKNTSLRQTQNTNSRLSSIIDNRMVLRAIKDISLL